MATPEYETLKVIDDAVDTLLADIKPEALEIKFKEVPLATPAPVDVVVPDYSKMSREELFAELDKWRDDPNFTAVPLPFDYIKRRPILWDEKGSKTPFNEYIQAHEMLHTLAETPKHEDRVEKVKARLRKKMAEKAKRQPNFVPKLAEKTEKAKALMAEEKSGAIVSPASNVVISSHTTASGAGTDN